LLPRFILVVDDDDNLRSTLAMILQREEYRVRTARSAAQAIEILEANLFDLVLLDMNLPDANGLTVLTRLRGLYPTLPVLILTAYPSTSKAKEVAEFGYLAYLIKPVDPSMLLGCIEGLFSESSEPKAA